jgi:hypothetical protein
MYHIALVQNQSEMAHYGYADARALFGDLGYEVTLYTAQNVSELSVALQHRTTDAVVLGSNALNDKMIRAYFEEAATAQAVSHFLECGGGLLSFHQLRVASMEGRGLTFLPESLGSIVPVARSTKETSASGELAVPGGAGMHTTLLYPNQLAARTLEERALNFRSLQGLYWHYWESPELAAWDVLLTDVSSQDNQRPLLLASKETEPYRVVLSALTLDWQRQRDALQNVLSYVVEGRHNTAIITQDGSDSQAIAYLTATLRARRFPFRRYHMSEGLESFDSHVESGVHTTVVLDDDVSLARLRNASKVSVEQRLNDGSLKVLSVEGGDDPSTLAGLSVLSHQTEAHRFLSVAELAIQGELRVGNIDGSFWGTAETLQVLESLPEVTTDFGPLAVRALALAAEHDRDGSYDETFGVTCALYWMRATYLGIEHPDTRATDAWIRPRLKRYESREQVLAYRTFALVGTLTDADRAELATLLEDLSHDRLSEIDLIAYIKAAIAAGILDPLPSLVDRLLVTLGEEWVDLATTASAAAALLDARRAMRSDPALGARARHDLDDTIRRAVVSLQDGMSHFDIARHSPYPWEDKASTTVRCLEAWAKFDTQVAPPVYELIDQLVGWDRVAGELASTRTSLAVLDELKEENDRLADRVAALTPRVRDTEEELKKRRLVTVALVISLYCLLTVLLASIGLAEGGILELLDRAFVQPVAIHIAVATLVAAIVVIPWHRRSRTRQA